MLILYRYPASVQRRVGSGRVLPGGAWPGGAPPSLGRQGSKTRESGMSLSLFKWRGCENLGGRSVGRPVVAHIETAAVP